MGSLTIPSVSAGGLAEGPHTLVADGVRFWYCVGGRTDSPRAPLVFVHGGPGQGSQHFAALTGPRLEEDFVVVYYDQRGSGRSERPWNDDYTVERLIADLERLREGLGTERISLIGHSFGGLLALEYAAAHPDRVERLILVAALSDVPATLESMCTRLQRLHPSEFTRAAAEPLPGARCDPFGAFSGEERAAYTRRSMFPDSAVAERLEAADRLGGLRNTGELSNAFFGRPESYSYRFAGQSRITAPVLVVAGREDHQIGLDPQQALAASLPNAELAVIDDAGHFPHLDQEERFLSEVRAFLRK